MHAVPGRSLVGLMSPLRTRLVAVSAATLVLATVGAGVAVALNSSHSEREGQPAGSAGLQTGSARTATIAGHLWLCGGPAPGRCFSTTIGGCDPVDGCGRSDRVVAIDTAGKIVAEQRLRYPYPNGRFRLHVRPGRYAVELLADGPRIHDRVMQIQGATARAGHTTAVVFTFDIP